MKKNIVVNIPGASNDGERYIDGDKNWSTERLIHASSDLEVFDLPLAHIDLDVCPWSCGSRFFDIIREFKRCQEADLKHPIILSCRGAVMNGWHRIGRSLLEGKPTIKAVRFQHEIDYDFIEKQ